ncbi:MAG: hypothetical protein J5844_04590, partial [Clostridia bacterium]|nr:hypothetical protein [Clostridia bacterium]
MKTGTQNDKIKYLLGGIGTGCAVADKDGVTSFEGFVRNKDSRLFGKITGNLEFAAYVSDENKNEESFLLSGKQEDGAEHAKDFELCPEFPFVKAECRAQKSNAIIKISAFNPTSLHNSVDSGIPAVFYDFEIENPTDNNMFVSVCAVLSSEFEKGKAFFGFDAETGSAYIELSEQSDSFTPTEKGHIGISSTASDFSFSGADNKDAKTASDKLLAGKGYLNNRFENLGIKDNTAFLCASKKLSAHSKESVRFLLAWNFPYFAGTNLKYAEKNYYTHYFPTLIDCIRYCVSNYTRLYNDSLVFRNSYMGTCMAPEMKDILSVSLFSLKSTDVSRDSNGVIYNFCKSGYKNQAMLADNIFFFPGLYDSEPVERIKELISPKKQSENSTDSPKAPSLYDTDCSEEEIYTRLLSVVDLFSSYKYRSDLRFFSQNWVDISYMTDILYKRINEIAPETKKIYLMSLMLCCISIMIETADILKDKKRRNGYLDKYNVFKKTFDKFIDENSGEFPSEILSVYMMTSSIAGFELFSREILEKAAENLDAESKNNDFLTSAALEKLKYTEKSVKVAQNVLKNAKSTEDLCASAAILAAYSGFEYDKNTFVLSVCPNEKYFLDESVYRGFVSFDEAYGYIEQGIDYVDIIIETGSVKIRKVKCSHRPYKVLYAGRLWPCSIEGNTVTLDSNLSVNKTKKL